MRELLRRLNYLLHRRRYDGELASDMEVHREMAAHAGGMPVGNVLHLREEARDAWGWTWIDRCLQDLRYAARILCKSPAFTLTAVLILAVGTGVNIAAFGFFDFMVLRPLNVRQPASILRFHRRSPQAYSFVLPYPEAAFVRQYSSTLSSVLALNQASLTLEGQEKPVASHFVSANWFTDLGATARLGRLLDSSRDESPDADPVVVLSHGFWIRRFGGDPSVVGRVLRLNGKSATIVGVAAPDFTGLSLSQPDLWAPLSEQPYFSPGSHLLTDFSAQSSGVEMWGRLAPGCTPQAAAQELQALAARLRAAHPRDIWEGESLPGEPGGYAQSLLIGGRRGTGTEDRDNLYPVAALLGTLTLLILAAACASLGSLVLARGVARDREIAIRVAVGAGRGRLVRQLLTESLLLALVGSATGLLVGYLLLRLLMASSGSPAWLDPTPDWRIVTFALGMAGLSAALFGLTPALQITRRRRRTGALRQILIAAQVAASCVLLIVAALLAHALHQAASGDPGFEYRHVLAINPALSSHGYTAARAGAYMDTLKQRLLSLPGVQSVSVTNVPPFGDATITGGIEVDGRVSDSAISQVDPAFFATMKIPLLAGRSFYPGESHAVIVSELLAHRLWPAQNPVGKQIGADTVVSVVGNARMVKLEDPDLAQIYYPVDPTDLSGDSVVVRTAASPNTVAPSVSAILKTLDPSLVPSVVLLPDALHHKLETAQYGTLAVSILGFAALGLACLGITGIVAYAVSQRVKEIGIRMALGARPAHVLAVTVRQFALPVFFGLLFGIGGAAGLARILRRVLFGVSGVDPLAYMAAIGIFTLTVGLAAWFPARRALRIDPMRALRCD